MNLIKTGLRWLNDQLLLLIFLGMWILVMLFINFNVKVAQNAADTRVIAEQTKFIAEEAKGIAEQTKALAVQNNDISTASKEHVDCIAQLFARYTRDGRAITIQDLNTCQATESKVNSSAPVAPQPPKTQPVSQSSAQPTSNTQPTGVRETVTNFLKSIRIIK